MPVDPAEGPFLFLVCGEPYVDPLYPAPFRWFGGDDDLESAIAFIVRGESDRAAELGLWSGFDFVLEGERALLNIDVAVRDRLATIRVTNVDGIEWQPPTQMMSSLGDVAMFVHVLAATALQYDGVDAVDLSVCPPYGPSQHCAPLQRSGLRARHPSDWNVAPSCSLLDYWTVPDCSPANR